MSEQKAEATVVKESKAEAGGGDLALFVGCAAAVFAYYYWRHVNDLMPDDMLFSMGRWDDLIVLLLAGLLAVNALKKW